MAFSKVTIHVSHALVEALRRGLKIDLPRELAIYGRGESAEAHLAAARHVIRRHLRPDYRGLKSERCDPNDLRRAVYFVRARRCAQL